MFKVDLISFTVYVKVLGLNYTSVCIYVCVSLSVISMCVCVHVCMCVCMYVLMVCVGCRGVKLYTKLKGQWSVLMAPAGFLSDVTLSVTMGYSRVSLYIL